MINYKTKSEIVFDDLREKIVSGVLKPGERISAGEIAKQLNVSRTPVNEAVKRLAEQGLVKILPNVGFEVRVLEWQDIEEIMYLKCQIEKFAIKMAIEKTPSVDFEYLRQLSNDIRQAVLSGDKFKYYKYNKEFHFGFCKIARAKNSLDLYQRLWDYEGWYADQLRNTVEDMLFLCDDHDLQIDAMEARDLDKALKLSDAHAEKCISILRSNLSRVGCQIG